MTILKKISGPADVAALDERDLPLLAQEIRKRLIGVVSKTGGHLASNLGVVELTIALLRVFSPPVDKVVWDVGHQSYTWKLLTGRQELFDTLRQHNGLSGFTKRYESDCDPFGAGHAGTAISAAMGIAVARDRQNGDEAVVAVVGDASLSNGVSLEALNNLATTTQRLIVVLNDNEMSIGGPVGAISAHLGRLLSNPRYNRWKGAVENLGHRLRLGRLRHSYHRTERAVKSLFLKNALFEELGLRYMGPVNGHDIRALCDALTVAREYKRPIVVHVATTKGRGYGPAEKEPESWHGTGCFDPESAARASSTLSYSTAMGEQLCDMANKDPSIVALTAAMCSGTGLKKFASEFPGRFFDTGICEEHTVVLAAGMASQGFHPFVALYSTFLQRAIDCVMHDVCLQGLPVTLCIDRAGVVGSDGPTHHGVFDIAMLRCLPGLTIAQPRNLEELKEMMVMGQNMTTPLAIRYPRTPHPQQGKLQLPGSPMLPVTPGVAEVVAEPDGSVADLWFWALGDEVTVAISAAKILQQRGLCAGVVNARFVKPLDEELLCRHAASGALIVTMEDGALTGGFGSAVGETLLAREITSTRLLTFGWPDSYIPQGDITELRERFGLSANAIAGRISAVIRKQ